MNEDSRKTAIRWFLLPAGILGTVIPILYLVLYLQIGAWQILAVIGCILVVLPLIPVALVLLRRNQLDAVAYLTLGGIIIIYGGTEFFWAGGGLYNAITIALLLPVVGSFILPRKPASWLTLSALFVAYVVLINWLAPGFRYDSTQSVILSVIPPAAAGVAVLAVIGYAIRALHIGTIRTRLLVSFIAMALAPAVAISASAIVIGGLAAQQQVESKLVSVAVLKEAEIDDWVTNLQTDLNLVLAGSHETQYTRMLLDEDTPSVARSVIRNSLRDRLQPTIQQTGRFDELFIMDRDGALVLSTEPAHEGRNHHQNQDYFRQGLLGPYVSPLVYDNMLDRTSIVASQPIKDAVSGEAIGVLAGHANLAQLNRIMTARTGLGETAETYLVDTLHMSRTANRFGQNQIHMVSRGIDQAIEEGAEGSGLYDNYRGTPVVGAYRWVSKLQVALLAEQTQAEAFQSVIVSLGLTGVIAALFVVLAAGASLVVTRGIARPLSNLAQTATQIAAGNLDRVAVVPRADETGALARAFNSMTAQLRDLIGGLEQRVADRTRDLERRSAYLEAAAEVGRAATSILEANRLIRQIVELIRERFGLYYVGLFLVDELGEWAVLQAGTGMAGQAMLARRHRIRIGEGMIGWCIAHEQARIALYAEQDAVRLLAAELPDTRAEAALPLRSRGQVLGALTVQSEQANAFDPDILMVLQTMADQVAVALDNARLLAASQETLEATRRAYGELSRQAWARRLRERAGLGYRSREQGIAPATDEWSPEMEQAWRTGQIIQRQARDAWPLAIPIQVRDQVIGVLSTHKLGPWTTEEIALVRGVTDQLGAALESSRLFEETQRRAQEEQQLRAITAQVRDAPSLDTILRTAAQEIARALGVERAFVQLGTPPPLEPDRET